MTLGTFIKQESERFDLDIDFTDWLADLAGDTIASAVSTVDPVGLTIDAPSVSSPIVKQWYDSGADGERYKVTVTATTTQGRIKEVEFFVRVRDT